MKRIQVKFFIMAIVCLAVVVDAIASVSKQDTIVQICRSFAPPKPKDSVEKDENHIYEWVQEKPSFPGREEARLKWLQENISYPSAAAEANIQGTVTVRFVVEKDGSISNVKIVRGVHPLLDDEAMRLTANMPKWEPGKHNGKVVRCHFTQPVKFELEQDTVSQSQDNSEQGYVSIWRRPKAYFPGGEEARLKWLSDNMVYPADAAKANIEGLVTVSFIVEKDGSISNVKILKGVHPLLDEEAVRLTKSMPKWIPGKANGKAARAYFTQPINFVLRK